MPNDPRDPTGRKTPVGGYATAMPRAVTEIPPRTTTRDRDKHVPKHPSPPIPVEVQTELTPITRIEAVRSELKDEIAEVSQRQTKVEDRLGGVEKEVSRLAGATEASNQQMPIVLDMIRQELNRKAVIDEQIVESTLEVHRHREIAAIETQAAEQHAMVSVQKHRAITEVNNEDAEKKDERAARRAKRKRSLLIWTALTSTSVISALLGALAHRC